MGFCWTDCNHNPPAVPKRDPGEVRQQLREEKTWVSFVCTDLREMGMEITVTLMNSLSYKIVNFTLKIYLSCNSLFYVLSFQLNLQGKGCSKCSYFSCDMTQHVRWFISQYSLQSRAVNLYVLTEFLCGYFPSLLNPKYAFLHISLSHIPANFSAESLDLHGFCSSLLCP